MSEKITLNKTVAENTVDLNKEMVFRPVEPFNIKTPASVREEKYSALTVEKSVKQLKQLSNDVKINKDGTLNFIDHKFTSTVVKNTLSKPLSRKKLLKDPAAFTIITAPAALITSTGVMMTFMTSNTLFLLSITTMIASMMILFKKPANVLNRSIEVLTPKIIKWFRISYGINMTENIAANALKNMLQFKTFEFESGDGKKQFKLTGRDEKWFLEEKPKNSDEPYKKRATSVTTYTPGTETQKAFLTKILLLNQQDLEVEDEYAINRAEEEAYRMLHAAANLEKIGAAGTQDENIEEAFIMLNKELDRIIMNKTRQEENKILESKQFIMERNQKQATELSGLRLENNFNSFEKYHG